MPDITPSDHHVPFVRDALIHAAARGNTEEIDAITDRLAEQGMCRRRSDQSRMGEWIARRPENDRLSQAEAVATSLTTAMAGTDIGSQLAAHFRGVFAGAGQ